MNDEKLKIWLGFAKFLLGTVALGLASALINHDIQSREVELKEMEQLGTYVEHALNENIAVRRRFAQYFATVVRSPQLRERWQEYSKVVEAEYVKTERRRDQLAEAIRAGDVAEAELEAARAELAYCNRTKQDG